MYEMTLETVVGFFSSCFSTDIGHGLLNIILYILPLDKQPRVNLNRKHQVIVYKVRPSFLYKRIKIKSCRASAEAVVGSNCSVE